MEREAARDRTVGADPFHWEPRKPLKSMRIGILQKDFDRATGDQKKVFDQAIEDLKAAGVSMTPTEFQDDGPPIRFRCGSSRLPRSTR